MSLPLSRLALIGTGALLLAVLGACGGGSEGQSDAPPAKNSPAERGPLTTAASASWVGDRPIVVRPDLDAFGRGRDPDAILITGTLGSGFGGSRGPAGPNTGGLDQGWFLVFNTSAVEAGRVRARGCELPVEGHPDYCMLADARVGYNPQDPPGSYWGVYSPDTVSVYDAGRRNLLSAHGNSLLEAKVTGGGLKAGEAFEIILQPGLGQRMFTGTRVRPGDVAVIWLSTRGRNERFDITTVMPAHVFLPVNRPPGQ
jgi:hypothetical protein